MLSPSISDWLAEHKRGLISTAVRIANLKNGSIEFDPFFLRSMQLEKLYGGKLFFFVERSRSAGIAAQYFLMGIFLPYITHM